MANVAARFERPREVDDARRLRATVNHAQTSSDHDDRARGRAVEGILISGAGHQWPGQAKHDEAAVAAYAARGVFLDPPAMALDATPVIWKFFSNKSSE
jgi:polyhydroxybutyrate depolymerase